MTWVPEKKSENTPQSTLPESFWLQEFKNIAWIEETRKLFIDSGIQQALFNLKSETYKKIHASGIYGEVNLREVVIDKDGRMCETNDYYLQNYYLDQDRWKKKLWWRIKTSDLTIVIPHNDPPITEYVQILSWSAQDNTGRIAAIKVNYHQEGQFEIVSQFGQQNFEFQDRDSLSEIFRKAYQNPLYYGSPEYQREIDFHGKVLKTLK